MKNLLTADGGLALLPLDTELLMVGDLEGILGGLNGVVGSVQLVIGLTPTDVDVVLVDRRIEEKLGHISDSS